MIRKVHEQAFHFRHEFEIDSNAMKTLSARRRPHFEQDGSMGAFRLRLQVCSGCRSTMAIGYFGELCHLCRSALILLTRTTCNGPADTTLSDRASHLT